jgi:hypothetical protein
MDGQIRSFGACLVAWGENMHHFARRRTPYALQMGHGPEIAHRLVAWVASVGTQVLVCLDA